jgi:hypothetical protein
LISVCGSEGSIIAYYAKFEMDRIKEMASQFSDYADQLNELLERFVDPLPIIRESVYDNDFMGSFSLKYVAPAILGDQHSYKDMVVSDGTAAQRAFEELIAPDTSRPFSFEDDSMITPQEAAERIKDLIGSRSFLVFLGLVCGSARDHPHR